MTPYLFVTIFNSDFNRLYSEFLSLLIVWLSPWLAIYVIDWALRKGKYDPAALLQSRGGRYSSSAALSTSCWAAAVKADVAPSPAVIEGGLGGVPGT